jgi:ABC-type sugar transport system ATPase subunit
MVKRWRERGNAVIFISHRMAEVSALCDRATVLRDGVTAGVTDRAHGSEERIVSLMLGAETARAVASVPSTRAPHQRSSDVQPALEVRGLRRSPLDNEVSFKLYPGEVLGVAALEGQGQEELFDCIAGSSRYDEGAILAHGKELRLRHPADAIAAGIVLVPAALPAGSVLSEVGIAAQSGAYAHPWDVGSKTAPIVPQVQANWFTAQCQAVAQDHLGGIYFWPLYFGQSLPDPADGPTAWAATPGASAIANCFSSLKASS